ncbi:DUF2971 domain-containing protein [Microbulbifer variabilis]|uniref:DUF2971 domain-containing protein n=1 Tax=Microbulbifer variabilis TaxID=266805 RepID=A0ABY4VA43_9GAMM|nr:DUF2971 domain-containing protein [Microbulbifer variabilis]USD19755.1 DUF2971 domain-containing protein [Microbulbifer variabilis]
MDLIYHYTDIQGLFGILDKDEFWLTDHRFLNDPSEGAYADEILKDNKDKILADCNPESHELIFYNLERTYTGSENYHSRIYVGSFSAAPDRLSQWRGYCAENGGYCIGFNLKKLQEISTDYDFCKCNYDYEKVISRWKELAGFYHNSLLGVDYATEEIHKSEKFQDAFNFVINKTHMRFETKDPGYYEEEEIRLYRDLPISNNETCYRPSQGALIPFIKLKGIKDCIEEIIVGPLGDAERNYLALSEYKAQKSANFVLAPSAIRFR